MGEDGQNLDSQNAEDSRVAERRLGGKEFQGRVEHRDPNLPQTVPAPDGIPEKFWDPIEGKLRTDDLIKSYSELEKRIGKGRDDASDDEQDEDQEETAQDDPQEDASDDADGDQEDGQDGDDADDKDGDDKDGEENDGDEEEAQEAQLQDAITAAQEAYAETGELPDDVRQPLREAGITDQQIDLYLAGVKAQEAALQATAREAAGSDEALSAAMEWAAQNWSDKKKQAYNALTGDPETVGTAVAGLMADFRKAVPGEGKLTNINSGLSRGDVYESMAEFQQDLAKADALGDGVARSKAIKKLARSKKAGTVKSAPRTPLF